MKKVSYVLLLVSINAFSQIGIGTTAPTETLDVDGTVRIREVPPSSNLQSSKDYILASDNGVITSMTAKDVIAKGLPSAIKGSFSTSGLLNLSLLSGSAVIPFDEMEFDINNEFNTSEYKFVATEAGIYEVKAQVALLSTISAASSIGVQINKNGMVVQENSFANITLLSTNVTPPVRTIGTLLQLAPGDEITFSIVGDIALGSIDIQGDTSTSYFYIHQIR